MPVAKKSQVKIRLSEDVRKELAKSAKKNGVTLNGEIVSRLSRSLDDLVLLKLLAQMSAEITALRASIAYTPAQLGQLHGTWPTQKYYWEGDAAPKRLVTT